MSSYSVRKKTFAAAATILAFLILNLVIAALHLDRSAEDKVYSDVYSVVNHLLPDARVPFANAHHRDVYVNNLGFRGPPSTWQKPAGIHRLVSLGDSSTFGSGVEEEETYTARLRGFLRDRRNWEVINCGIPGVNLLQQRFLYDFKLKNLAADFALIYVVPNVREDLVVLRDMYERRLAEEKTPLYKMRERLRRVPLYRLMLHLIKGTASRQVKSQVEMIYKEHREADKEQMFLQGCSEDLELLRAGIVSGGGIPVWVWHINRSSVEELSRNPMPDEMIRKFPIESSLVAYFRLCENFARHRGDLFINPYPAVVRAARDGAVLFQDEAHPTAKGHEALAEAIREKLGPRLDEHEKDGIETMKKDQAHAPKTAGSEK